jgi:hypothetical protein
MTSCGNRGVQRGEAPLLGVWEPALSPSKGIPQLQKSPKTGGSGGSKAFLNALSYIIMIKEEK